MHDELDRPECVICGSHIDECTQISIVFADTTSFWVSFRVPVCVPFQIFHFKSLLSDLKYVIDIGPGQTSLWCVHIIGDRVDLRNHPQDFFGKNMWTVFVQLHNNYS